MSTAVLGDPPPETDVALLDAAGLTARLERLSADPNFEDLLEGVEASEYGEEQRNTAKYVLGRDYEALKVYEVEEPGADDQVLPVFEAVSGGIEYDSRTMGLGELAALALLWQLNRLDPETVVLVEEPETYLSSRSTVALLDVLAERVNARRLYAVVTTHSAEIVARAPLETVRLLITDQGAVRLHRPLSRAELEHMLNAYVGQARLIVVEDRTAARFVSELLSQFAGLWAQSIRVLPATGVDAVWKVCKNLPETDALRLVGALDGDQADPHGEASIWPVVLLPGGTNPDAALRAAAVHHRTEFAGELRRGDDVLAQALTVTEQRDDHDWFPELGRTLGLETAAVIRGAVACWLLEVNNASAAKDAVDELLGHLSL
jgi:hypothetical protein